MLPSAMVEQQAKLGVSVEESKAQRLKRQQARFRDRGGAFVPSDSNPLVDILLARTVSGESPSKTRPNISAKRSSLSKARRSLSMHKAGVVNVTEEGQVAAGSSRSKPPASRKRKPKATGPNDDAVTKPAPKRRGRPAKSKKEVGDSDNGQPPPNPKPKPASKAKGKRKVTSDANLETKTKPRAKTKSNATKEVLVSDDDRTLVDSPHKVKSNPKKSTRHRNDSETDDDAPIVRKRAIPRVGDDSNASGSKATARRKTERIANTEGSEKRRLENGKERLQNRKTDAKKCLVARDDSHDDGEVISPFGKKRKVANSTSMISQNATDPVLHTAKDVKVRNNSKGLGKGKGKNKDVPDQDGVDYGEDDSERPPERVVNSKKRKQESDSYESRPRKTVKFSETGLPHSSSQKLKENQSNRKHKIVGNSNLKDEPGASTRVLATKPPSRAKTPKGPPRKVLERIKASAVQYLRCADSEPDELDCLS